MSNCVIIKCGVPQVSILGPLFFLLCIKDLPKIINKEYNMVLYADDMSIIITDLGKLNFKTNINKIFYKVNTWLNATLLMLNFENTQYLEFLSRNCCKSTIVIEYDQKSIVTASETKFLGLIIDYTLSWSQYIYNVINKLSMAIRN
jgi:hypothetical protein